MNRKKKGSSLVELGAGCLFFVPVLLYTVDYASIFLAKEMNSSVCNEAARAAASGPPTMFCPNGVADSHRPRMRAKAVIDRSSKTGAIIQVTPEFKFWEDVSAPIPVVPYGGPVKGFVRVQTIGNLNPPFVLPFVPKAVPVMEEKTFPYTWVMPPNYNMVASTPSGSGGGPKGGAGSGNEGGDAKSDGGLGGGNDSEGGTGSAK